MHSPSGTLKLLSAPLRLLVMLSSRLWRFAVPSAILLRFGRAAASAVPSGLQQLSCSEAWPPAIDCACYYTENFFVDSPVLGPSHFTFANEADFRREYAPLLQRLTAFQQEELLASLEQEAERRRLQPVLASARKARLQAEYAPLHPELWTLRDEWLHDDFVALVRSAIGGSGAAEWRPPPQVAEGVYALPVFSVRFCELLCEELDAFERSGLPCGRPNSMNKHGALLDELGLYPRLLNPLIAEWLVPLCARLPVLAAAGGASLDGHKSFVVTYRLGEDEQLTEHYDNAEVTLNANLGVAFEEGELCFYGHKDRASAAPTAYHEWTAGVGHAVLHLGQQVHSALPITEGERRNLVVWMRSTAWRQRNGCPMCGARDRLLLGPPAGDAGDDDGLYD